MGRLSLLQQIFLSQESNRGLLYCRRIIYQLSYQGSPHYDKSCTLGGFPGSPVVKTWPSYAGGACLIPGCGTKIPHASWPKKTGHKVEAIKTFKMLHIKKNIKSKRKRATLKVFPGGPGVRTPCFYCHCQGSVPSQGTKILKTVQCGQKIRKRD